MAAECPDQCPNILSCEERIQGLYDREQRLLKDKSILDANLDTPPVTITYETSQGTLSYTSPTDTERRDWRENVQAELLENNDRLVHATESANYIYEAQGLCKTGPIANWRGRIALFSESVARRRVLADQEKADILASDVRYRKCGSLAGDVTLRRIIRNL